jgi:hypothetical protein
MIRRENRHFVLFSAVADIAKKFLALLAVGDGVKILSAVADSEKKIIEVFGPVSNSPIHTGLRCVKFPPRTFHAWAPLMY